MKQKRRIVFMQIDGVITPEEKERLKTTLEDNLVDIDIIAIDSRATLITKQEAVGVFEAALRMAKDLNAK